jgi:uncharacterized protein (TIGR02145 family)
MKKIFFLMLTFLIMNAASMNAQVTIGSDQDPHGGAVLDLSQTSGTTGFLLPRVALTDVTQWAPLGGTSANGTGMVVYNTNAIVTNGNGAGIYVWSGNTYGWVSLNPICSSVTDSQNNTYLAAQFGAAGCWMTQNLRSTYTYHGTTKQTIPEGSNSSNANAAFYYYPNANTSILDANPEYGLLYTWAAANIGVDPANPETNPTNRQGICPTGWHLPTDAEWNQLEEVIANDASNMYSTTGATTWDSSYSTQDGWRGSHGQKMKSTTLVTTLATNGTSKGSNINGFDVLLLGGHHTELWFGYGEGAYLWTSSSSDIPGNAWFRTLVADDDRVARRNWQKFHEYSVRCKKN